LNKPFLLNCANWFSPDLAGSELSPTGNYDKNQNEQVEISSVFPFLSAHLFSNNSKNSTFIDTENSHKTFEIERSTFCKVL
jgi:hypothetical protein